MISSANSLVTYQQRRCPFRACRACNEPRSDHAYPLQNRGKRSSSCRTPAQYVASDLTGTSVSTTILHSSETPLSILPTFTCTQHDISDSAVPGQHKPEAGDSSSLMEIEDMEARASKEYPWTEVHHRHKLRKSENGSLSGSETVIWHTNKDITKSDLRAADA